MSGSRDRAARVRRNPGSGSESREASGRSRGRVRGNHCWEKEEGPASRGQRGQSWEEPERSPESPATETSIGGNSPPRCEPTHTAKQLPDGAIAPRTMGQSGSGLRETHAGLLQQPVARDHRHHPAARRIDQHNTIVEFHELMAFQQWDLAHHPGRQVLKRHCAGQRLRDVRGPGPRRSASSSSS